MADDYKLVLQLPPNLEGMIRQEAKDTGNTLASIIRRRVLDSYRREAADLGAVFYPDPPDTEEESPVTPQPVSE